MVQESQPNRDERRRLQTLHVSASNAFIQKNFEQTVQDLEAMYQLHLELQRKYGTRYHKGWELHNAGVAYLYLERLREAAEKIFLAYVEDALTAPASNEADADSHLAARVLNERGHGRFDALLESIKGVARERKESDQVPEDPNIVFKEAVERTFGVKGDASWQFASDARAAREDDKRKIAEISLPYEKRCFVGGAYRAGGPNLEEVRQAVEREGFDAIVAGDFVVESGGVHHHSLMLLHLCHKAIFEVTVPAGQLMELERCRDYDIRPLIVQNVIGNQDLQTSEMIGTMADSDVRPYMDNLQLRQLIETYLRL